MVLKFFVATSYTKAFHRQKLTRLNGTDKMEMKV